MTGEREWACCPQVPGIAIAQLSRVDDIDAFLVTRWEWDGSDRRRGAEPGGTVRATALPAQADGHEQEGTDLATLFEGAGRAADTDGTGASATFAARHLAGAHALDEGTPLATLVLSGLRSLTGFPDGAGAEWRREA
ncbi:TIGR02679 domain-containing protein [Streptomyces sp. NPDC005329]|uniref:TIGR02679 domain-containing protein n=1 Tax=Streptomyces sp. NPDC005329 TaxID=3157034 RepID=UPI0033B5FEB3